VPPEDRTETAAGALPHDDEIDTVLEACRVLVAITARSMAAASVVTDLLHLRALVVLSSRDALSLGALASAVGIHLTRASRLCDRLVSQGLVDRADDPANRRQLVLRLTPAGRQVVDSVMHERAEAIRPILARMDRTSRARLVASLHEFARAGADFTQQDLWALGWDR
jgi:DNA-binding MarR family transcriptional regulator